MQETRERLTNTDRELLTYINRVGFTSPIVLQIKFNRSAKCIQENLSNLYIAGFVLRPTKGLVLSTDWLLKNPHKRMEIEQILGTILPVKEEG